VNVADSSACLRQNPHHVFTSPENPVGIETDANIAGIRVV